MFHLNASDGDQEDVDDKTNFEDDEDYDDRNENGSGSGDEETRESSYDAEGSGHNVREKYQPSR